MGISIKLITYLMSACIISSCAIKDDGKVCDSYIYIGVMNAVGALPNDYAINSSLSEGEIRLDGNSGVVLIEDSPVNWESGFGKYLLSNALIEESCGLQVYRAESDDVSVYVVEGKEASVIFTGVPKKDFDFFVDTLCHTRSARDTSKRSPGSE
jgi:hypothetical protein